MSEGSGCQSCACQSRAEDHRKGLRLEFLSLGWSLTEAAVAVAAGVMAGSVALMGFGADSVIESFSSVVLLWRLSSTQHDERRERIALRGVGICFLLLAVYILADAGIALVQHEPPHPSLVGIALSIITLLVMPVLARAKRKVAARLDSAALAADSRQTDLCAWLAAIVLLGLALNAALGWWWADPVAALIMVPIIFREGLQALRGEVCAGCC